MIWAIVGWVRVARVRAIVKIRVVMEIGVDDGWYLV
jgi:hypothetical protein